MARPGGLAGEGLRCRVSPPHDVLFERLDGRRFRETRKLAEDLLASGDRAVSLLEFLVREAEAV